VFPVGISYAQLQESDISISINPPFPSRNENVTAKLSSYAIDLNKTKISWSINQEEVLSGIGKSSMSFNVGDYGENTTLLVKIDTIDGKSITKSIVLSATELDLLWEATDSYVPPFYKGKALIAKEGSFKIVAVPYVYTSRGQVSPNNLSYTWKKDDAVQVNSSGWGKSSYLFRQSYLDAQNIIEVKVGDVFGNTSASGRISTQNITPKILFYEKNNGFISKNVLPRTFDLNKEGSTIVAVPYFFSPRDLSDSKLKFEWFINGTKISTPVIKNELSIKGAENKSGLAKIKVIISNTRTLFQNGNKEINANI
jgi:hypothetical protein